MLSTDPGQREMAAGLSGLAFAASDGLHHIRFRHRKTATPFDDRRRSQLDTYL